ncbi:MAG: hypothetical protein R2877_08440 [Bdellovibrionota bacterium]
MKKYGFEITGHVAEDSKLFLTHWTLMLISAQTSPLTATQIISAAIEKDGPGERVYTSDGKGILLGHYPQAKCCNWSSMEKDSLNPAMLYCWR